MKIAIIIGAVLLFLLITTMGLMFYTICACGPVPADANQNTVPASNR